MVVAVEYYWCCIVVNAASAGILGAPLLAALAQSAAG